MCDVSSLLPVVEEGDTIILDRRTLRGGSEEWNRYEATVKSVRDDGITLETRGPGDGWEDLQLLLDYGNVRIAQETQRTLGQFESGDRSDALVPAADGGNACSVDTGTDRGDRDE